MIRCEGGASQKVNETFWEEKKAELRIGCYKAGSLEQDKSYYRLL